MKISVVVPCYNSAAFIIETISSLTNQTHQDLEIICVNDGSSDNTLRILEEFRKKDNRIIILNKHNGGIESALKLAVKHIKGYYTFLIGHDDTLSPETFELAVQAFNNDNIDAVRVQLIPYDKENNKYKSFTDSEILTGIDSLKKTIMMWEVHNFLLWKSEIFKKIVDVNTNGLMNYDELATRYLYTKCKYIGTCKGKYYYQQHPESVTKKLTPRIIDTFAIDVHIKKLLQDINLYHEFEDAFESYMFKRLKKATETYYALKSSGHIMKKRDLTKLKSIYSNINYSKVTLQVSKFEKIKFKLLYSIFPLYLIINKKKYAKSTSN